MDEEALKQDYKKYSDAYSDFQDEVSRFLIEFINSKKGVIDVLNIIPRLNGIKKLESIIKHLQEKTPKYNKYSCLTDIKDLAGVRITCYCNSDRERLYDLLEGELRQKYVDVVGDKKESYYRAYHFNFAKIINDGEKDIKIYCEIQIRTVLGNAWATLDTQYVYKKKKSEGEPQILSSAISDILNSCENLWELVKDKCKGGEETTDTPNFIKLLPRDISNKVENIKSENLSSSASTKAWLQVNKVEALKGKMKINIQATMEVFSYLKDLEINTQSVKLLEAARESQINTFGWPIGVFIDSREDYRPKPNSDGIKAELSIKEKDWVDATKEKISYDYWAINKNGSFYLLKSIFEDQRKPGYIFFNTRIVRIAETLMYLSNLYKKLGVGDDNEFYVEIRHTGLKGRIIGASGNRYVHERTSNENESAVKVCTTINQIENNLVAIVKEFTTPLFEIFDFFSVSDEILTDIVNKYKNGQVT